MRKKCLVSSTTSCTINLCCQVIPLSIWHLNIVAALNGSERVRFLPKYLSGF